MALQMWSAEKSRWIHQRIVVEGDLVLRTPAHFGTGEGDDLIDMPLLLDAYDDETPLLTGASIAGALRSYLRSQQAGYNQPLPERNDPQYITRVAEERKRAAVKLFGGFRADDEGLQSPLIIEDAYGQADTVGVELRTGVRLEGKTRTASHGALYDMRLWRAGTIFRLRFELLVGQQFRKNRSGEFAPVSVQDQARYEHDLKQALVTALDGLSNGHITLGAHKRRGYGQVEVNRWRVKTYDLTNPVQLCDWLKYGSNPLPENMAVANLQTALQVADLLADARHFFHLHATFTLDGSLLIRSSGGQDDVGPDMVHLHSYRPRQKKEMPILSGTSLAGALRARATRIANTLDMADKATELIYGMFGADMNDRAWMKAKKENEGQASRVLVEEAVVENGCADLVQSRVGIDRFTGGARDTALFNQQPVWGKPETTITITLRLVNPTEAEIGLLMLLLKDLWTGDLPLGGESSVGRGRLQGKQATLTHKNRTAQEWVITAVANNKLQFGGDGKPETLQTYVNALRRQLGGQS